MEPSHQVLARLERIGALDRNGAAPAELLAELRELVREAEACTRDREAAAQEGSETTEHETGEVVARLRTALARDIIG
jgi:hypothetical protein